MCFAVGLFIGTQDPLSDSACPYVVKRPPLSGRSVDGAQLWVRFDTFIQDVQ